VTHFQGGEEQASFLAMYYDPDVLSPGEIRHARNMGKISKKVLQDILDNSPPPTRAHVVLPIYDDGKRRAYANGWCLWGDDGTISASLTAEVGFLTPSTGTCRIKFEIDIDPWMARMAYNYRREGEPYNENFNFNANYSLMESENGIALEYWAYKRQTKRRAFFTVKGHFSSDNVEAVGDANFQNRASDSVTMRTTFEVPVYESKAAQTNMGSIVEYGIYQREKSSLLNRTKDKWAPDPIIVSKPDYDSDLTDFFLVSIPGRYTYWKTGVNRELNTNGLSLRYRAETNSPIGKMLMPPAGTVMRWDETEGIYWLVDTNVTTPEVFGTDRTGAIADCEDSTYPIYIEGASSPKSKSLINKEVWDWIYADPTRSSYDPDASVNTHWFADDSVQLDDELLAHYGCNPGDPGCANIYDVNEVLGYDLSNNVVYRKPCVSEIGLDECDEVYELWGFTQLLEAFAFKVYDHDDAEGGISAHGRCYWPITIY
jgi:hypothetical protein